MTTDRRHLHIKSENPKPQTKDDKDLNLLIGMMPNPSFAWRERKKRKGLLIGSDLLRKMINCVLHALDCF